MSSRYEALKQVRKSFKIAWYRSSIERGRLEKLTQRSDLRGTLQTLGHLGLILLTATATCYFFSRHFWIAFALALFVHGTIYSFIPGYATHELSHGTVFRTKWANALVLRFFGLITWFNPHHYKLSHTYHHLYTLHQRGDRELLLPIEPTLHFIRLLQLFSINLYSRKEPWSYPLIPVVGATVKLALMGKLDKEWLEAVYEDQDKTRKKAINWARLTLGFHLALFVVSASLNLWCLPIVITFGAFIANWYRYFVGAPMHTGLMDNTPDFRLCVRTITLDPFSEFIYWHMNWHTEHHMYAGVPCYNLASLSRVLATDLPKPRTLLGAWREMRETWRKQQLDSTYQYVTPLPGHEATGSQSPDTLRDSLGELKLDNLSDDGTG